MTSLRIVTYHYVRDFPRSRLPGLKGRHRREFEGQLDYLQKTHRVLTPDEFVAAINGALTLTEPAAVLTFDDGYLEHYAQVFPSLMRRGITGYFFPPTSSTLGRRLLEVNKIHVILSLSPDHGALATALRAWIDGERDSFGLDPSEAYWRTFAQPSRYDPAETMFVKRTLQKGLPTAARAPAVDALFRRVSDVPEAVLADEFYLTRDQLRVMAANGMGVGGHGRDHVWLTTLDRAGQEAEIDAGLAMMEDVGVPTTDWVMCYPFGGRDETTLRVLESRACAAAVTVDIRVAEIGVDAPLLLPRLDTNDLPLRATAKG